MAEPVATAANIDDNEVKLSGSSQTAENGFVQTIRACDAPFTLSRKGGGESAADWKGSLETSIIIEGPTFAKILFQNTKPIITLPPSLLKCCIENKANIALHWAEINII